MPYLDVSHKPIVAVEVHGAKLADFVKLEC